jgi:hypothetical protein
MTAAYPLRGKPDDVFWAHRCRSCKHFGPSNWCMQAGVFVFTTSDGARHEQGIFRTSEAGGSRCKEWTPAAVPFVRTSDADGHACELHEPRP